MDVLQARFWMIDDLSSLGPALQPRTAIRSPYSASVKHVIVLNEVVDGGRGYADFFVALDLCLTDYSEIILGHLVDCWESRAMGQWALRTKEHCEMSESSTVFVS